MSIFASSTVPCPACEELVECLVVFSLNADRRPDLRSAILDRTFQSQACGKCSKSFRLAPEFTYFDLGRRQWILVQPVEKLAAWTALEKQAYVTFLEAYGPNVPPAVQAIGRELDVRVTFGWAALREKILANQNGLDDVTLELMKSAMVRGLDNPPLADDVELRLVDIEGDELVLAWIKAQTEGMLQLLRVPRSFYDEIAGDDAWRPLRKEISAGPFVDMNRLLVAAT